VNKDLKTEIAFEVGTPLMHRFLLLLQHGFMVRCSTGCSVRKFLCEELGLNPEYVSEKIQTVFLDGRPVDDLEGATVKNGSRLSLSSAMPGLVGVTLKRGSILASFRKTITYVEESGTRKEAKGSIYMKLFNLVMKEMGHLFLERGIYVQSSILLDFIRNQNENFLTDCRGIKRNGVQVEAAALESMIQSAGDWIYLKVIAGQEEG
jgi:hypothetical protein